MFIDFFFFFPSFSSPSLSLANSLSPACSHSLRRSVINLRKFEADFCVVMAFYELLQVVLYFFFLVSLFPPQSPLIFSVLGKGGAAQRG